MKKVRDGKWFSVLIIAVIILAVYIGIKWWNKDVVTIKAAQITPGQIEAVVSASGVIDAPVYELGSRVGGRIAFWNVEEGDMVQKGATLAEYDDTTRIVAPANGVVAKVNYDEGETVVPGSNIVTIVNYKNSWVDAQIDEIDIADVKLGDQVKVSSDVYPDKIFSGEVTWIAPLAELRKVGGRIKIDEESYVFPCKIKFLGDHSDLKVNMSVNADIITKQKEGVLLVPREAIATKDDASIVYRLKGNRVYETKFEIGIRSFSSVEALSGLSGGDTVAISNLSKLKDKARIKIERQ
ncbi:hypothetical protein A2276_03745 [candidate division WOR-1 bacterium RIFOXYA12_FULL_43_27]|uniref:Uncharacterized protein n=1 Tax=candidate division WOR-1 bacterium RIFOXYC2_FULL_46_14 TaxID=1802587 RepID=A0A1F4U916_UNCSA|nr:MAG: hypothetical protein A2276_03745 [candidate division WOR-1 bacterium RIFOXYA12_FULL_43_27]OGC19192.1 MAG: hypothetical protein A2292_00590 [candidate division WOR-1 bacterium RIFOXYB2_FULL_46_45]OGC30181.1 MAG: hypothetical protein A2232_00590 [candidate division WOR-1 bacterium RIFOXYA2_FULL_46_56]OGC40783.1 MAG: hypothetical protein A2438_00595 [candidate division WOR-1 bacterium RIFOXYC2_FULL_46_14]